MDFTIDIFSDRLNLSDFYAQKARELNNKEYEFRTKLRFISYPEWKIAKQKTRVWITLGGCFMLNYTMYEYADSTGKKKRITYYHDKVIEQLKYSKYDFDLIKFCLISDLNNQKLPDELVRFKPSKQLLFEMKKRFKINEQIALKNKEKYMENISVFSANNYKKMHMEVDDFYTRFQSGKYKPKMRVREVILHSNFIGKIEKKQCKKAGAICYFFTKNLSEKTVKNEMNLIKKFICGEFKNLGIKRKKVVLKGDGAKWMSTFASDIKVKYCIDYFHLIKKINDVFGYRKFNSKAHRELYKNWFSSNFGARWVDLFGAVFDKNFTLMYDDFLRLKRAFLEEASDKNIDKSFINEAVFLFRYIKNHARNIWNDNGNLILFKSYTEHFVWHSFKKFIKKQCTLYSEKDIKNRVIYQNLLKNVATFFVDFNVKKDKKFS